MDGSGRPTGRVAVVIPTYNERANVETTAGRIRRAVPDADLLIVDDNSPDGTGEIADKLAAEDSHIHVLHRTQKAGLGAAYIAGFRWALAEGYDVLVEMDADGSHQPEELPLLLDALKSADLVLGSRWVAGGTVRNWPKSRELLSRGGNTYARLMLGIGLKDATGGYRAYRATTLRAIALDEVESQGYCFQIDLAMRAIRAGLRVVEVPITFVERVHGTSKMSRAIVVEALWRVTVWGLTGRGRRFRRRPASSGTAARSSLRTRELGALALASGPARAVAAAITADQGQPLGQHLLQVGDGPALAQHVPVAARRLDLLGDGQVRGRGERNSAAHPAFPSRGNLGLGGERNAKVVPLRAVKSYFLAWRQVRVTVVLIARCSEPGAA